MKRTAIFAVIAVLALLPLMPANAATVQGPLGGTCETNIGSPVGISTETFYSSDGSGNTITYMVETECLVKGASLDDTPPWAYVTYWVNASCTSGTCPATATISATVEPAANSNNQAKYAGAEITEANAFGAPVEIAPGGANGIPVQIFEGNATLTSFQNHGQHSVTVALFGSVTISAGGLFPDVSPGFSVQWQKPTPV
jgi:hypothetical protein